MDIDNLDLLIFVYEHISSEFHRDPDRSTHFTFAHIGDIYDGIIKDLKNIKGNI